MSEKWPTAEEVESKDRTIGDIVRYLSQFAALLRQMEAHGSPRTDALCQQYSTPILRQMNRPNNQDVEDMKRIYERDLAMVAACRHFESALGAVEAMTVERCAKVCEQTYREFGNDAEFPCFETQEECAKAIRSLLPRAGGSTERRMSEPRKQEYCRECDGCGWYEGGSAIQNTCHKCGGKGVIDVERRIRGERRTMTLASWQGTLRSGKDRRQP